MGKQESIRQVHQRADSEGGDVGQKAPSSLSSALSDAQ
jgi:hypothetical protein